MGSERLVGTGSCRTCRTFFFNEFGLNANCNGKPWEGFKQRRATSWLIFENFILGAV